MKKLTLIITLASNLFLYTASVSASENLNLPTSLATDYVDVAAYDKQKRKILYTNLALASGAALYGLSVWDWGDTSFHTKDEGWISDNTAYGGADKFGHFYGGYAITRISSALYRSWGVSSERALRNGLFSSILFTTATEIGDGFSATYGFSYEDFISNTLGQLAGYYLETHPEIDKKIDIRLEYNLGSIDASYDPISSYNNMKTLVAIKASGFKSLNRGPLKYLEFHLGYYSRGFQKSDKYHNPERHFYTGIGLNISEIFNQLKYKKTAKIFNYYQLPGTYIE
ncbi:MAG: YfiM family protein [Chromatiales bacterium]|nr:YfiM family protein [Chromatiales bacterium]